MLPEIDFTFSYTLQTSFLRNEFDYDRLKSAKDKVEELFFKEQKYILKNIEKLSSLRWKESYIQVWVFTGVYESMPDPMLLNCSNKEDNTILFDLVRILAHNIFIQNKKSEIEEEKVYAIAIKIMRHFIGKEELNRVFEILELTTFRKPLLEKSLSLNL